jgi:Xaa-Pro aminopeptidase
MIEDMVVVTEDGVDVMSDGVPTSSAEIERLMQEARQAD